MIYKALSRLGKNSLIYGIGGAFNRFIALLLLPFFTRVLSPKDYGIIALISLISIVMSGLLSLGTGNSMGILYFKEQDFSKRPSIIWSNFILMAVNGFFWYALIWYLSPSLSHLIFQTIEYQNLIRIAFLASVIRTITDPWLAFLRMEEQAKKYLFLTVGGALINAVLSFFLVLSLEWGVWGLLVAGTTSTAIMIAVVWYFVGRNIKFSVDPKLFLKLIRIGFPSVFGLFAFFIIDYADRQMIERLLSLSDLGVYSVGYSFGIAMLIAVSAFSTAWPPFFMSYVKKQDEARQVFGRVFTYYLLGFGTLCTLFFFVAKPVIGIMVDSSFQDAWTVVGLVASGYMLKGCYLIFLPGIYFSEKLVYQSMIEWFAAIVNLGLNIWLIPILGIFGAAIATFLSYLSLPLLAWFIAKKYLRVDYEWDRLLVIVGLAAITCIILFKISESFSSDILKILVYSSIVCSIYLIIILKFSLCKEERNFILKKIGYAK